jgi:hypothetical protein
VAALEIAAAHNAAAGDRRHRATALEPLAVSLAALGRMAEAREAAARALTLRRELGDSLGEAQSLAALPAEVSASCGSRGGRGSARPSDLAGARHQQPDSLAGYPLVQAAGGSTRTTSSAPSASAHRRMNVSVGLLS